MRGPEEDEEEEIKKALREYPEMKKKQEIMLVL